MKTIFFDNDYSLVDGNRVVKNHRTEFVLEEFLVTGLQKLKFLSMHISLSEVQADVFIDCMIDEHFSSGGDMKGFESLVERMGGFLDYYLDRLPKSVQIPDDTVPDMEERIPDSEESIPNLGLMEETMDQPF